jgi:hypothetical protein
MKKKTVITTETREVWVIRQAWRVAEEPFSQDMEADPTSQSPDLPTDHDSKEDNDSSESTTPDIQE